MEALGHPSVGQSLSTTGTRSLHGTRTYACVFYDSYFKILGEECSYEVKVFGEYI